MLDNMLMVLHITQKPINQKIPKHHTKPHTCIERQSVMSRPLKCT